MYTLSMQVGRAVQESSRDRAYRYLRETVLVDPSVQGTFLSEVDLATEIGVSRTPVREALLLLVADDLIEMVPQRGAYVPPLSGRQIRELMELRGVLERHSASVALKTGTVPLDAMRAALRDQERLTGRDDAAAFIELDRLFHQSLVDAASNELLSRTYAGLRTRQVRVGIAAIQRGTGRRPMVCDEHRRIVAALEAGDEAQAHEAIEEHLRLTLQQFLET
jgi:DNA-binding GntR family transcriptional regulator